MSSLERHVCNLCEYSKAKCRLTASKVGWEPYFPSYRIRVEDVLSRQDVQPTLSSQESLTIPSKMPSPTALTRSSPISTTSSSQRLLSSDGTRHTIKEPERVYPVSEEVQDGQPESKRPRLKNNRENFNLLLRQKVLHNVNSLSRNLQEIPQPEAQQSLVTSPLDALYKSVFRPRLMRTVATPVRKTSVLLPRYLRKRPSKSRIPTPTRKTPVQREEIVDTGGILKEIQMEVPGIKLSTESLNHLSTLHRNQTKFLNRKLSGRLRRKSASQKMYEENLLQQVQLAEIAERNQNDNERLMQIKEMRSDALKARGLLRDSKIQSARAKRYYEQYHIQHQRKMSAKKSNEEMLLEGLYKHRLALQREQVHALDRDLRDQEKEEAEKHRIKIASANNFYQNQMDLLVESASSQREQENTRRKAQSRTLEQARRAIRQQIENEVKTIQENLEQADDFHFSERNASNLLRKWSAQAS